MSCLSTFDCERHRVGNAVACGVNYLNGAGCIGVRGLRAITHSTHGAHVHGHEGWISKIVAHAHHAGLAPRSGITKIVRTRITTIGTTPGEQPWHNRRADWLQRTRTINESRWTSIRRRWWLWNRNRHRITVRTPWNIYSSTHTTMSLSSRIGLPGIDARVAYLARNAASPGASGGSSYPRTPHSSRAVCHPFALTPRSEPQKGAQDDGQRGDEKRVFLISVEHVSPTFQLHSEPPLVGCQQKVCDFSETCYRI